jgi:heme-degrading monooxygenase HmoA
MIYELREYVATPGAAEALHARFADHTLGLFEKHGLEVLGVWTDPADADRIVYLLRFADEQARDQAWAAFKGDPNWQAVKAASETAGPLLAEQHSRTLIGAPYWTEKA